VSGLVRGSVLDGGVVPVLGTVDLPVLGAFLEFLAAEHQDHAHGEEGGEDPPLDRVAEMRSQVRVRGRNGGGHGGDRRILRDQDPVGTRHQWGGEVGECGLDLVRGDGLHLPGRGRAILEGCLHRP
jgi:hypothetical protein